MNIEFYFQRLPKPEKPERVKRPPPPKQVQTTIEDFFTSREKIIKNDNSESS